jgi:hypothetical protein
MRDSQAHKVVHTIEAVLETLATGQFDAIDLLSGQESIQGQTEKVVAQGANNSLPVQEAAKTGPANLSLELVPVETRWVEQ